MLPNYFKFLIPVILVLATITYSIESSQVRVLSTCTTLTSTSSTSVKCKLNDGNLPDCKNPLDGTIARLSCNQWFEHPDLENNPIRLCKNGRWDLPIHQCYPTCGLKTSKGVANIINGTNVMAYGDYPWQIGVYISNDKRFICGGSIIAPHAILSAAHCFTDFNGNIEPVDNYIIAAGKYYRTFDDERDQLVQYSKIRKIYVPERFKAQYNLFSSDVAIIILKDPFQFSTVVQPVCINYKEERQQLLDSTGIVTGWGYTEEGSNLSEELKELIVPLVPFTQCFNQVSPNFRKYITYDKICAGYKSKGTSICQGDSGGALVYKNAIDDRHYVIGIVSTSPASEALTCDSNEYGTYTSVSHHFQFVRESLSQHQSYESVECTRPQCSDGFIKNRINCNSLNNFCNTTGSGENCEIPPDQLNTQYKILGEFETNYKPGDFVKEFSVLETMCLKGYNLNPSVPSMSTCIDGKWNQSLPDCLDTCPSLISTETTTVKCSYNNVPLENCSNPVNGTTVLLSCNPFYEEPNIQRNSIRVCKENNWNPPITHCYPICGIKHSKGMADGNGREVKVGDNPWHTGIYSSATKEYICGGSLINENILLTAAHCVADENGKAQPPGNYLVAAGKVYSKYNETKDLSAQYSNISAIHVPERYRGFITNFELDLAVLILSHPFTLSKAVQPVCIQFNEESDRIDITSNISGIVHRWGYAQDGEVSVVLKEFNIQYVPFNKCFNEVPPSFRKFLTEDSICGGNINNESSICSVDSNGNVGGGFVFKDILSDRYFIKGIRTVSQPPNWWKPCDPNRYDLYTLVDIQVDFVRTLVALNQIATSLVCTNSDCANKENQRENNGETESENCEIPLHPLYGKYKISGELEENYTPAKFAKQFSILEVRCHKGYAANPIQPKTATCINGKWNQSPMVCLRTCPSLISTESTTVTCSYNKITLKNCISPVKGTIAILSCNAFYEEPNINPIRVCEENRWNHPITDCNPICGMKRPQGNPLIADDQDVTVGDYPWQTAMYNNDMEIICSGILIERNIILTAAHCVTDFNGTTHPVGNYLVAAGKYHRGYNNSKDLFAQYTKISAIHVPERFKSTYNQRGLDIAVLVLENPFTLTNAVQPVCIEAQYMQLSPKDEGLVTGWGITEEGEVQSDVLQELRVSYVPFVKCFNELPLEFKQYFTQDKFCGVYLNNGTSKFCNGDSGGGIVFKNTVTDRYFVKGIVSTTPFTYFDRSCDSNQYNLYTSIDHHIKFVQNLVALNHFRQPLECVGDDCKTEENQTEKNEESNNSENCAIPLIPYAKFKILGESKSIHKPGDIVNQFSKLQISCREEFSLTPFAPNTSFCIKGKWNPPLALCLRTCPSLISTESTRITCRYNNILLENCTNPVSGTMAFLFCNPLYEEPTVQRNPVRLCKENMWEPSASNCYPICGLKHPKENSDVVGMTEDIADESFSWQVGIYQSIQYTYICSGSIIRMNIILTAAHCLTDTDGVVLPADDYSVAAGKKFREYLEARDLLVQYTNVLKIYVPEEYKGRSNNMFAMDIAVLILSNRFPLFEGTLPICLDLNENSQNIDLSSTNDGIVTTWGFTQERVSIVPFNTCVNESAENLKTNITQEKICGVYINNGTTVGGADGGAALVFQNKLSGRYFVKGVVSTSLPQELATYESNKYNLYTSVDHHIKFLQDIVTYNEGDTNNVTCKSTYNIVRHEYEVSLFCQILYMLY